MKQIIIITDGCSNVGVDPVLAASQAKSMGISVNVIGVVQDDEIGVRGETEIREIAEAGGGLSRIVASRSLAQTMHMMMHQTMLSTIHGNVRAAILIDTSASMKPKLEAVKEAACDLMLSIRARINSSELAILYFPGNSPAAVQLVVPFSNELAKLDKIFYKLNMKGTTPTGPAILETARYLAGEQNLSFRRDAEAEGGGTDAVWGDYVV